MPVHNETITGPAQCLPRWSPYSITLPNPTRLVSSGWGQGSPRLFVGLSHLPRCRRGLASEWREMSRVSSARPSCVRLRWLMPVAGTVLALVMSAVALPPGARGSTAATPIYLDPQYSPRERAADLLSRMTLDEKLAMVHGGQLLPGGGAGSIPGNQRLGIPALNLSDSPLGVGNFASAVTQSPDGTSNAATWDPNLVGH